MAAGLGERSRNHSQTFTIKNNGSASNTFGFACSGSGGVTCGAPPKVPLGPGAQTTRTQSYSVGDTGTGTLTLTATGTNASNAGSYSVPIEINLTWIASGSFVQNSRTLGAVVDGSAWGVLSALTELCL